MPKKLFSILTAGLILAACSKAGSVTLNLDISVADDARRELLLDASQSVIERVGYAIDQEVPSIKVASRGDRPQLKVQLAAEESAEVLVRQMTSPIDLFIMREADEDETPDLENENVGAFMKTGLTEKSLEWVETVEDPDGLGAIVIHFTEEGRGILQTMFNEYVGKEIGLFVRGGLVSKYTITDEGLKDNIIIRGVPSVELAQIFADDVNVGAHVTFSAVQ